MLLVNEVVYNIILLLLSINVTPSPSPAIFAFENRNTLDGICCKQLLDNVFDSAILKTYRRWLSLTTCMSVYVSSCIRHIVSLNSIILTQIVRYGRINK